MGKTAKQQQASRDHFHEAKKHCPGCNVLFAAHRHLACATCSGRTSGARQQPPGHAERLRQLGDLAALRLELRPTGVEVPNLD